MGNLECFGFFFFSKPLPCSQNITIHLVNVDFHPWSHCSTLWLLFTVFVCILKTFWMSVVSCMQWLKMHFWRLSIAVFISVWLWLKIHLKNPWWCIYTWSHSRSRGIQFSLSFRRSFSESKVDWDQGEQMKGRVGSVSVSGGPALWRSN